MSADLSFSVRVAQQLAQIEHGDFCNAAPQKIVAGACDCDRDQRVAAAVARAIEACEQYVEADVGYELRRTALEALGASPQPETRPRTAQSESGSPP